MAGFRDLMEKARRGHRYWASRLAIDFAVDLNRLMKRKGMKNADLAREIGTSNAYISRVMRGDANFTIETMVKLAMAVDGRVEIKVVDKNEERKRPSYNDAFSDKAARCVISRIGESNNDDGYAPVAA